MAHLVLYRLQGKTNIGNDRALHHYAGALNAVPLIQQYLAHPDDTYLLRVGMAGIMGSLTNLQPAGGPSMAFHGDPSLLRPDGYSADWGIGFFGHASQVIRTVVAQKHHLYALERSTGKLMIPETRFLMCNNHSLDLSPRSFLCSHATLSWAGCVSTVT